MNEQVDRNYTVMSGGVMSASSPKINPTNSIIELMIFRSNPLKSCVCAVHIPEFAFPENESGLDNGPTMTGLVHNLWKHEQLTMPMILSRAEKFTSGTS